MSNQPNEMVMFEWLLPLFNQQLSQLSEGWQIGANDVVFEANTQRYHELSGALVMVNLPYFAALAAKLSLLSEADYLENLSNAQHQTVQFAHQLLKYELNQYAQTGCYRGPIVVKTTELLMQIVSQNSLSSELIYDLQTTALHSNNLSECSSFYDNKSNKSIFFAVPILTSALSLKPHQYQQLLNVWRQHTQALFAKNSNHSPTLAYLERVSHYLWQSTRVSVQQRLWYITELWLQDLPQNVEPLPECYTPILARLEQIIEVYSEHAERTMSQKESPADLQSADESFSSFLAPSFIEDLIADIYIQLSCLTASSVNNQKLLNLLSQSTEVTVQFLPRILREIKAVISALDEPQILPNLLQSIKTQLSMRGWMLYESQVSQILVDVNSSLQSESRFSQIKSQIEQQLQELYRAINHTEESIRHKVGKGNASVWTNNVTDYEEDSIKQITEASLTTVINDDALRQLRIAVEDVKNCFNDYLQRQQTHLLPSADAFIEIGNAFEGMNLSAVRQVTDKMSVLFSQLVAHNVEAVSWKLTQALADGLSAIELLLDYLAQQVFDQTLLAQAGDHIDNAAHLLEALINSPIDSNDTVVYPASQPKTYNVIRYDNGDVEESADLQDIQAQMQPDNFDGDDEIRDIFIEEVHEAIADSEIQIAIWLHNTKIFTPLMEVSRSYEMLSGSGSMIGAFSISKTSLAFEKLLTGILDKSLTITDDVINLVVEINKRLPSLVVDFTTKRLPSFNPAVTVLQVSNLLSDQPINHGINPADIANTILDVRTETQDDLAKHTDSHVCEEGSVDTITSDVNEIKETISLENAVSEVNHATDELNKEEKSAEPQIADLKVPEVLTPFIVAAGQLPCDTQDADPDIKAIFIEEAEEVLAEITPLYLQWEKAPESLSVLSDIRRGFHTLKGSGRMVGAHYTAELAWAIEDLLNRILDHSITASIDMIELISDVLENYPSLIQIFSRDGSHRDDNKYPAIVPLWVACAQAYSKQLGDNFSYPSLSAQWFEMSSTEQGNTASEKVLAVVIDATIADKRSDNDSIDSMLQTIHAVNEIMADVLVVMPVQSLEEQAFCEIFIDEAQTLLQYINNFVNEHEHQAEIEVSDEIVRAFHTLRAASGSNALAAISEVSATIEHSLEQLQQQDNMMNAQHLHALTQSTVLIGNYLVAYAQSMRQQTLLADTNEQSQQDLASLQAMLSDTDDKLVTPDSTLIVAQLLDVGIDGLLDAEWELNHSLTGAPIEEVQDYVDQQREQIARLRAQTTESPKFSLILHALEDAYHHIYKHPEVANSESIQMRLLAGHAQLVGLFDALAGSMSLKVDAQIIADLQALAAHNEEVIFVDKEDVDNESANEATADNNTINQVIPSIAINSTQADELQLEAVDTDIELLDVFLEEAQDLDSSIAQTFAKWRTDIDNIDTLKILQRYLHTMKGGARMAGIRSIGDLTHEAENIYAAFVEARLQPTQQWLSIMQLVQDSLSLQIDYVVRYQESFFAHELIAQLQDFEQANTLPTEITLVLPALQNHISANADKDLAEGYYDLETSAEVVSLNSLIALSWTDGLPDPDILEVFLEEADELTASSNKYLQLFLSNISDVVALQALQRDLHTIKGGARMVGAHGIADLAHQMETVYEELAIRRRPATKMISQLLVSCHDWLADAVFILKHQLNPPMPVALIDALKQFSKNPDSLKNVPIESLQTQLTAVLAEQTKRESVSAVADISEMPPMAGNFSQQEQSSSNEMIRISGSLIERMINLSGESAINRARIDMGMSSLTNSIEDMGTTIQRLAEQLRLMETELEEQILSQIDDAELLQNEGFDPLEMDQYSSLNQLSKSLTESASDLVDINSTLLEKTRDSENLLLQLSRTQTELQAGLMDSRMLPFARLTPRLERIVRQTANELNKSVELIIVNADDEMDRTILERITSPLEHMLRNAVDHGIESPQMRLSAGKKRNGHITLEVLREGSEVVINLTDDGRGINVDAVRNKAISQGLMAANDTNLSELEVMQYIFSAGLTTSKQVTQISGRGVGMDVVISEIRQLGGVVSVSSDSGQGSRFTIRVPLTVAISDALVVRAADRYYVIPLVQIERVVRINPEKLYHYYQSGSATMLIEDTDYQIRYLNEILTGNKLNELMVSTNTSLPVIIVKNRSGQRLALQVDQIAGSRIEVVVKPLGRQLSHLAGISAATIMGDGSVMLILDLIGLLRNAQVIKDVKQAAVIKSSTAAMQIGQQQPTVLVVDDSVTVRKVTSRFLERQGFTALVAKDGVDAIEILQELTPDLILLDTEMPRMDGFEVATQVRHNKRLQQIPIIMITSRTGEKHRERAFGIGVNDYMGKPFQENELLSKIQNLLGITISPSHEKLQSNRVAKR